MALSLVLIFFFQLHQNLFVKDPKTKLNQNCLNVVFFPCLLSVLLIWYRLLPLKNPIISPLTI